MIHEKVIEKVDHRDGLEKDVGDRSGDVLEEDVGDRSGDVLEGDVGGRSGDVLEEDVGDRSGDVLTQDAPGITRPRGLLDLPVEILANIFSHLDFGTIQNVLPFVCRRFEEIARDAVFNTEFQISCETVNEGLQQSELELVCRRKRHITMMRIKGDRLPNAWTTQHIPRVIFDLAAKKHWENLTHFSVDGRFKADVEEMLVDVLRSGSMRNLQHLRVILQHPLSCHSLTHWDTPNLKTIQYRSGLDYWEFVPKNYFDALFCAPEKVTHFTLDWEPVGQSVSPTRSRSANHAALQYRPYSANHFLDRCGLHNYVKSLGLLSSMYPPLVALGHDSRCVLRAKTLVNPWPKVTRLRVSPFVFDKNEYEWVLEKFPSLIELVVQFATEGDFDSNAYWLKRDLLQVLGNGWEGTRSIKQWPRNRRARKYLVTFRKL
jgi:F-box-like